MADIPSWLGEGSAAVDLGDYLRVGDTVPRLSSAGSLSWIPGFLSGFSDIMLVRDGVAKSVVSEEPPPLEAAMDGPDANRQRAVVGVAADLNLLDDEPYRRLDAQINEVKRMLNAFIRTLANG